MATVASEGGRWPRCRVAAAAIAAGYAALLALHLIEPPLAITWSYAHLGRHPARWAAGALAIALLPPAVARLWASARGRARPLRASRGGAALGIALLALALAALGLAAPSPTFTLDGWFFTRAIARFPEQGDRWFLAVRGLAAGARLAKPEALPLASFLVVAHALLAAIALAALSGACRLLARDVREQWAMTALAWSALGVLQISLGYVDVYPAALAVTAVFFWAALRALAGEIHPAWAIALAALGPFVYLGLVLLAPPAIVLFAWTAMRPGGLRRAFAATAAATAVAGCATLPLRGLPFDWLVFARRVWSARAHRAGFLPDSSLLPGWYLATAQHWGDVASTLVLIDPVGCTSLALAGGALLLVAPRRQPEPALVLLAAFVGGFLAYLCMMDAVYGAFADWDLYSWGAAATSLLGGALLVRFGRFCPGRSGWLLGLAGALAAVHLLARLHALDVDAARHTAESPLHAPPAIETSPEGSDTPPAATTR